MRNLLLFLLGILSLACSVSKKAREWRKPKHFQEIASVKGDLTGDGQEETIKVFNAGTNMEGGKARVIQVLSPFKDGLTLLASSEHAVKPSNPGSKDPFLNTRIEHGLLVVAHRGGSGWKWSAKDSYQLTSVGFKLMSYYHDQGKDCKSSEKWEYEAENGKVRYTQYKIDCETHQDGDVDETFTELKHESFYKLGISKTLENRYQNEIRIVSPEGVELFL